MEQENHQANKNIVDNNGQPDIIEERITSMLEDVLKGDSSDEDLKKKMNLNLNQKQS